MNKVPFSRKKPLAARPVGCNAMSCFVVLTWNWTLGYRDLMAKCISPTGWEWLLAVADLKLVAKGYNFTTFWFALVVSILDYSQVFVWKTLTCLQPFANYLPSCSETVKTRKQERRKFAFQIKKWQHVSVLDVTLINNYFLYLLITFSCLFSIFV